MSHLDRVLARFKAIADNQWAPPENTPRFHSYALSNFRGGIGKTTLAFNLAYEISRRHTLLLMDVCPQRSLSELVLGDELDNATGTIYDALISKVLPGSEDPVYEELLYSVPITCPSFKRGKAAYAIPGSKDLFLFPSSLYTAINQNASLPDDRRKKGAINRILSSVREVVDKMHSIRPCERVLIDASPFFAGATHLAWAAVDALIIPVRVDQQSIDALELTLDMLSNQNMDFLRINAMGGRTHVPKVHAIAMTHCGWSRQETFTPDNSTQTFVSKVIELVIKYQPVFSMPDPTDSVFLLDDFHSSGRISGALRMPLSRLHTGQFVTIDKRRLQVNEALGRYQNEINALASIL